MIIISRIKLKFTLKINENCKIMINRNKQFRNVGLSVKDTGK